MFNLYFVCGGIFFCISRLVRSAHVWNVMMWFNLLIGTGMFVSCYASEWWVVMGGGSDSVDLGMLDSNARHTLKTRGWTRLCRGYGCVDLMDRF